MKSFHDRRLPITLWGAIALLSSLGITLLGVLRVELAALAWGAVITAIVLYALIAGAIARAAIGARLHTSGAQLRLAQTSLTAGTTIGGRLDLRRPLGRPPGFRVRHDLRLRWEGGRELRAITALRRGARSVTIEIPDPKRGQYRGHSGEIVIADVFGLVRFGVSVFGDQRLAVAPAPASVDQPHLREARGGEPLPEKPRRDRNDELLEVRPYVPGDDPRRFSWKHFAHSGELLLRIGEEVPPPNREALCVLLAPESDLELTDSVTATYSGLVQKLVADGIAVSWMLAGSATARPVGAGRRELLEALAGVRPGQSLRADPEIASGDTIFIVCAGDSQQGEALRRRLAAKGGSVSLLTVDPPPPRPSGRSLAQRVFLRPDAREPIVPQIPHRWVVVLLRVAALSFLALHYRLFVSELLSLPFLFASLLVAVLAGYGVALSRLRSIWGVIAGMAAPWLIRTAFLGLFRAERLFAAGPAVDAQNLLFDNGFLTALPVYLVAFLLTVTAARRASRARWEPLAHGAILVAVFWTQAHYAFSFYSHPSAYAASVLLFIAIEVLLLLFAGRAASAHDGQESVSRDLLSFASIVVPLIAVVLLFVVGRYNEGSLAAGGGLLRPTLFRFDFSQYVTLESEISMSDDLVLLYRRSGRPQRELLRRYVLAGYSEERGFFHDPRSGLDETPVTVPDGRRSYRIPPLDSREEIEQDYFLVNFDPTSLLALNEPVEVIPYENWDDSSFSRVYSVTSLVSTALPFSLALAPNPKLDEENLGYYTDYGGDEAIAELAREVTEDAFGYYERVKRVERHLLENYFYSLKPGIAIDGDQLSHFLFTSRKGYCSYFAFAMALMLRSLDIPARVAIGFFIDPTQEVLNFYPITGQMAHAWVEVYFGDLGWIEFDPTSQTPAPDEQLDFAPGADRDQLAALLEEILNSELVEPEPLEEAAPASEEQVSVATLLADVPIVFWYLLLPAIYLVAMLIQKRGGDLLAALDGDRRRAAAHRYRSLQRRLAAAGVRRHAGTSISQFATRAKRFGIEMQEVSELYTRALFAPRFDATEYRRFVAALATAERSLWSSIGFVRRALVFLNPVVRRTEGEVELPV